MRIKTFKLFETNEIKFVIKRNKKGTYLFQLKKDKLVLFECLGLEVNPNTISVSDFGKSEFRDEFIKELLDYNKIIKKEITVKSKNENISFYLKYGFKPREKFFEDEAKYYGYTWLYLKN